MIDEQKVIAMLQAKALGCLDAEENKDLQNFIDEGHLFPWEELGVYQNTASLLPLALKLEIPDPELKDKVALKLIKLRDELRAKKSLEEEKPQVKQTEELIEEEVDETVEDFTSAEGSYIEPNIEVELESELTEIETNFNSPLNADESTFNLDEIILPGFEPVTVSEPTQDFEVLENLQTETTVENLIEEPQIEIPVIEEVKVDEIVNEPEVTQINLPAENLSVSAPKTKPVDEIEDADKHPDLTKKSVAEKMFRAIEEDFDTLKYHFEESERKHTRGLLFCYVIIAVLLALIAFSFFKFSADIKVLEQEIKDLKKSSTSFLLDEEKISFEKDFFS